MKFKIIEDRKPGNIEDYKPKKVKDDGNFDHEAKEQEELEAKRKEWKKKDKDKFDKSTKHMEGDVPGFDSKNTVGSVVSK